MKKIIVLFTAVMTAGILILGGLGLETIREAQLHEVKTVQNIAGALITGYPFPEQTFVTAVMDETHEYAEDGQNLMSAYGYGPDMALRPSYKKLKTTYFIFLALLLATFLGGGYAAFAYADRRRKRQEKTLLDLLDCCRSGDYSFLEDEPRLEALGSALFTDSLLKLARSMRLKTEYLDREQDHTKTLVTDISHQLKTPISALKACLSMYFEADGEEEKNEFRQRIEIQMNKLEALIAALVQISRLENGMITIRKEETSLDEILIESVNTIYHKASKKNMNIITADHENVPLTLDKRWTAEAVANILDNAVKYSPCGTDIQIRAKRLYSFVRVEIEDQGAGIPKEEQNKIFRRFYRGENDIVKKEEGSGVGLYLARWILEEQGGTVSVRSAADKGSIFVLQLPL